MSDIHLHQWYISPFCGKIRKILALKGLAYQSTNYNGLLARKAAKLSAAGQLPVLEYDGERIQDSTQIAKFLDSRHPTPPLLPPDPKTRLQALFMEDWADESLYFYELYFRFYYPEALEKAVVLLCEGRPGWEKPLFKWVARRMYRKKVQVQGIARMKRQRIEAQFFQHLDHLEAMLADHAFLYGSQPCIADIAVSAQLDEMVRTSHLSEKIGDYNRLSQWLKSCDFQPKESS